MAGKHVEFVYSICMYCGETIQTADVVWYHRETSSSFCNRETDVRAAPLKKSITNKLPIIEDYSI
jgi:hypothetical protein